jgi:hypothetical protein
VKRRRRAADPEDDDVIDLRDRLAPYDDAAFAPPAAPPAPPATAAPEPELWTPIEFDFDPR